MKRLILLSLFSLALVSISAPLELRQASGKITMLRVHDVGTKYGPASDKIDVEVVIKLNTEAGKSFGFQLRNDNNSLAREGMLSLLKDAFTNNWTVWIDYDVDPRKSNGVIIRVWVNK